MKEEKKKSLGPGNLWVGDSWAERVPGARWGKAGSARSRALEVPAKSPQDSEGRYAGPHPGLQAPGGGDVMVCEGSRWCGLS